jgi:radical SAM protein with 4Fe4S-binding SPASM domain
MQWHKRPFVLEDFKIEVTYKCDLNCIHCSSDAKPSNPLQMSREDCLRIISEAAKMGIKEIAFSGGEPLLWPHIFEVADSAAKNRLKITIYTSGNTEKFGDKAKHLYSLGAFRFIFSLFGSTSSSHEQITRKAGSFERTKSAVLEAHNFGLITEIHFVPMASNYLELNNVAKLAYQLGASRISVLRLVPQGRAALLSSRILNRVQNLELRRQIQSLRKSGFDIRTGSPYNFLLLNEKPGCWAAINCLIIGPDLQLYPCDAFKRIDAVELVGTANFSSLSSASLSDCWEKSPYLEAVRNYLTTDFSDPCKSCKLIEKCVSGCLAQKTIIHNKIIKQPDPDCLGTSFLEDSR